MSVASNPKPTAGVETVMRALAIVLVLGTSAIAAAQPTAGGKPATGAQPAPTPTPTPTPIPSAGTPTPTPAAGSPTPDAGTPTVAPEMPPLKPPPTMHLSDHRKGKRQTVDRVVAVINDSVILYSELMRRVAPMTADLEEVNDKAEKARRIDRLRSQMLDDMVNEELIVQAAAGSKLEVSTKETAGALEEIKQQNKLDDNQFTEALRLQGYTLAAYREDVKRQILRMRAVNMIVRPRVTVTDDDVRAKYDAMSRRSAAVKRVKLRHILIALPDKPSEAQLAEAKKKAASLIERIKGGEDFARLAADNSDDEQTKFTGGDLGWIERGSIDTEWEVIVFAMNQGDVRGPITGPKGLHVFQVTEVERNVQKPFKEMKEQIKNELFRLEMDKQTRQWLDELRDKAHLEIKL